MPWNRLTPGSVPVEFLKSKEKEGSKKVQTKPNGYKDLGARKTRFYDSNSLKGDNSFKTVKIIISLELCTWPSQNQV